MAAKAGGTTRRPPKVPDEFPVLVLHTDRGVILLTTMDTKNSFVLRACPAPPGCFAKRSRRVSFVVKKEPLC